MKRTLALLKALGDWLFLSKAARELEEYKKYERKVVERLRSRQTICPDGSRLEVVTLECGHDVQLVFRPVQRVYCEECAKRSHREP